MGWRIQAQDSRGGGRRWPQVSQLGGYKVGKSTDIIFEVFLDGMSQATTDKARKKIARTKFSNPVNSDPSNCLTFHGFKTGSKAMPGSFTIFKGHRIPLAGVNRKVIDSSDNLPPVKMVKLEDFNQVMPRLTL